jgi:hypothetical protein
VPKLLWRVKLVAVEPGLTTERELGRPERDERFCCNVFATATRHLPHETNLSVRQQPRIAWR